MPETNEKPIQAETPRTETPQEATPQKATPQKAAPAKPMDKDFRGASADPKSLTTAARQVIEKNAEAEDSLNPKFGNAMADRFKVVAPVPQSRAVIGGVLLIGGVGYTGDGKSANICRGRGMEVIDRNPPARHAPPPSKTNEAHDKKHPPQK